MRPLATRALALLCLLAAHAVARPRDGFVERAEEIGLVHHTLTGLDTVDNPDVTAKIARDWVNVGLAAGDIDGDGDHDVVACGGLLPNGVFLNEGGTFTDFTGEAGINLGELDRCASLCDYDRDGDQDLFVGAFQGSGSGSLPGRSRLYANDGSGRFEDVTVLAGTYGNGRTLHGYWHDLDLDGLPDLYTSEFNLTPNCWYRNNGDGSFTELAAEMGLDSAGNTHVAAAIDSDQDGLLDVFVANDHLVGAGLEFHPSVNPGDRYLHGQPDGTFADVSSSVGLDNPKGVMGLTFADVDLDGDVDVYKSNIQNNLLLLNHGAPGGGIAWEQVQDEFGVNNENVPFPGVPGKVGSSVGWGTHFMNVDFDRWQDLFVVNGHVAAINFHQAHLPKPQQNAMFLGLGPGANFHFEEQTEELGLLYFNDERGCVIADFDDDGDTDILITSTAGRLHYHENRVDRQGQAALRVSAQTATSIPHGIGTVVRWIDDEGYTHTRIIGADAPTASQSPYEVEFGLGTATTADLQVTFLSGMRRTYEGVPAGGELVVTEPEMVRLSTRKMPVLSSGLGPTTVTVTAFAYDSTGVELASDASVQIEIPGLLPLGPVTHVADNEFQRDFETSDTPRDYPVVVGFEGWRPDVEPRVHVYGAPSSVHSTVVSIPEAVRAGTGDVFEIWVAPKDANGVSLGAGLDVQAATAPELVPTAPLTDHGDGRYSIAFPAPSAPASVLPQISVNGVGLEDVPIIDAGGPADGSTTTYVLEQGHPPQAASPNQIKMLLTPRDAEGRRLGPNAPMTVKIAKLPGPPTGGAAPGAATRAVAGSSAAVAVTLPGPYSVYVRDDFGQVGQRDGDFVFIIEKSANAPPGWLPEGILEVYWEDVLIGTPPFTFFPQTF